MTTQVQVTSSFNMHGAHACAMPIRNASCIRETEEGVWTGEKAGVSLGQAVVASEKLIM